MEPDDLGDRGVVAPADRLEDRPNGILVPGLRIALPLRARLEEIDSELDPLNELFDRPPLHERTT
jgi:hypothetical protein